MPTKSTPKKIRRRSRVAVQRAASAAPSTALLRRFAHAAAPARATITLRIAGAAEARRLNAKFRGGKYATNVLSFPYTNGSGDVVLCHPVIAKEAREQGKTLRAHYAHLVVHGILHLRGHDHLRKRDAARMERMEIRILRRLGFGNPYSEQASEHATVK
jgi:probable rRNA maturation factor